MRSDAPAVVWSMTYLAAFGRFLVTVEDALPQEVQGTSDVAKKITESGLEMADRLSTPRAGFWWRFGLAV